MRLPRVITVLAGVAFVLVGAAALSHLASRHQPVHVVDVAALSLTDQERASRSLDTWRGKVVVLDFIYTGCGDTCPLKTAQLVGIQAQLDPRLRDRVQFVSVSVDPEHDDPAALKAYASRAGADLSNWAFLTGDLSKVARFAAAFDAKAEPGGEIPSHITTVRLLDPGGRVVQRFVGEPVDDKRLAGDLMSLAALSAPGR